FDSVGVTQTNGSRRISWKGGEGPRLTGGKVWFRGTYHGKDARLFYSTDGETYTDTGRTVELKFAKWKGARPAVFNYGPNGGIADVNYIRYALGK
ncbi:MAG TPA: beta-xylosidase, partial [Verrucomicrobiae bacterium]|nr:beta-xylosidase [Verrucomicrobiae bacterium]